MGQVLFARAFSSIGKFVMDAIHIENLNKTVARGRKLLDGIDLRVAPGEMVAIIGASGSGKSTLLRHIAGFVTGDAGSNVRVYRQSVQIDGRIARNVRSIRRDVGFVFQQFNLVGRLSLETNVLLGCLARLPLWRRLLGLFPERERALAVTAMTEVGMATHAAQRADDLSGGQQQRAAIARVLVQQARLLLADEPIASLDPRSAVRVLELMRQLNTAHDMTVLVSLHQIDMARQFCPRIVALSQGRIVYDGPGSGLSDDDLTALYEGRAISVAKAAA
ncbi:phosphonate transport system ATP-binding protein [Sphingobium sp. OAS761]|nr:phosphonate transport system ATP-binding protein [Sphingobium sp. OAS761]